MICNFPEAINPKFCGWTCVLISCHTFELVYIFMPAGKKQIWLKGKFYYKLGKQSFMVENNKHTHTQYWLSFKIDLKVLLTPFILYFKFSNNIINWKNKAGILGWVHEIIIYLRFQRFQIIRNDNMNTYQPKLILTYIK